MSSIVSVLVSSSCPRAHMNGVWIHMAATSLTAALGLGPRDQSAHLPVFLKLRNINLPGPSSIMRREQV